MKSMTSQFRLVSDPKWLAKDLPHHSISMSTADPNFLNIPVKIKFKFKKIHKYSREIDELQTLISLNS